MGDSAQAAFGVFAGAAAAFLDDSVGAAGALAAFRSDAEMFAQGAYGVHTVLDSFADLTFGHGMADAYVHDSAPVRG